MRRHIIGRGPFLIGYLTPDDNESSKKIVLCYHPANAAILSSYDRHTSNP